MRGASYSWKEQQDAVLREHAAACAAGDTKAAEAIKTANPDLDFTTKETEA
ncbi:MAG: hypothetical protein Q7R68_10815 [Nitrospirales bacterium]|nr:hypothetical protein [Nitrospirales bacterium]